MISGRNRAEIVGDERASLPRPIAQPGKCLFTTIRELVENSLDSAESISVLPEIDITV